MLIGGAGAQIDSVDGRPAVRYELSDATPRGVRLVIHGTSQVPDVYLAPVGIASYVEPIHRVRRVGKDSVELRLHYVTGPGSYRLFMPGFRPFGLVNVGR